MSRLANLSNRVTDRVRHPRAWEISEASASEASFEQLRGHKYCLLVTFKRSGEAVPTPIWFGLGDGSLYVRSEPDVGKVKRIRNDARVLVAPCNSRGKPLGPAVEGRARVLPPAEEAWAEEALSANYGLGRRLYERLGRVTGVELVYVEVVPGAQPA